MSSPAASSGPCGLCGHTQINARRGPCVERLINARGMLHVACCVLHAACCMLHVACCVLHAARCMLHVACCMLCAARGVLHRFRLTSPSSGHSGWTRTHSCAAYIPSQCNNMFIFPGLGLGASLSAAVPPSLPSGPSPCRANYALSLRVKAELLRYPMRLLHAGACVCVCARARACIDAWMQTYIETCIRTYMHTYVHGRMAGSGMAEQRREENGGAEWGRAGIRQGMYEWMPVCMYVCMYE